MNRNKSKEITKLSSPLKENNLPILNSIKPKKVPARSPVVTRQTKIRRTFQSVVNQKTIDSYFKKPDKNVNTSTSNTFSKEHRYDKLSVKHFSPHKSAVKFKSCCSPSEKLESKVPKIDDILRTKEETEKCRKLKLLVDGLVDKFLKQTKVIRNLDEDAIMKQPKTSGQMKTCKHLSLKDIEKRFKNHSKTLDDITYDRVYNKRHELFKKDTPKNNFTKNDLRVNETACVFTEEQLIYIVSLFRNRYDNGNIYKYSDFYFKVLLPEYCLNIFMDCHNMASDKALEYLKSLPVPNYFGLTES